MKTFILQIIQFEKKLEQSRQNLALDINFSIEFFPETITYLGLKQLFNIEMKYFFKKLDEDLDGKITLNDITQFIQPRQQEYQNFDNRGGNYNRLIELILICEEYEQYIAENISKIELIFDPIPIKKFITHQFKPIYDKDIWYLNQRFECYTLEDISNYFKEYNQQHAYN